MVGGDSGKALVRSTTYADPNPRYNVFNSLYVRTSRAHLLFSRRLGAAGGVVRRCSGTATTSEGGLFSVFGMLI